MEQHACMRDMGSIYSINIASSNMIYTVKKSVPNSTTHPHRSMCTQINHIATICSWFMAIIEVILHCLYCPVLFNSESKSECNAALPLWCGHTSGNRNHPTTSLGSVRDDDDDDDDVDACRAHSAATPASGELTAPADQKEATACPAFPSGLAWNESLPTGRQLHQSASAQADNTTKW